MKKVVVFLMVCFVALSARVAQAQTITFTDTVKYWPGWGNGTPDDTMDTIGIPNFTGGQAVVNNGLLTSLTFNRAAGSTSYWGVLSPGDLFIDLGANGNWDYVVDLTSWGSAGANNPDAGNGNYNLYAINLALDSSSGYIKSGSDNTGDWKGYNIRDNHPVAADILWNPNGGTIGFTGWGDGSTTSYTFNLNGLNLGSSGQFAIGWMPNCANDVIYETLKYTPVPEPATMSLLGLGLFGLIGLKNRRKA